MTHAVGAGPAKETFYYYLDKLNEVDARVCSAVIPSARLV
jgi:hypothetical protein